MKKRVQRVCVSCGKTFGIPPGKARDLEKRGIAFYCGTPCKGKAGPRRNGGLGHRNITADGYVMVYVPPEDRPPYMRQYPTHREHRIVMGQKLGRHLGPSETVHHINGDRTDNRPENLQLRNGQHGKGGMLRCRSCGSSDIEHVELE